MLVFYNENRRQLNTQWTFNFIEKKQNIINIILSKFLSSIPTEVIKFTGIYVYRFICSVSKVNG